MQLSNALNNSTLSLYCWVLWTLFEFRLLFSAKMSLTCRIQYVDDTDPFEYSANVPEPQRAPPVHLFSLTLPLINQIAGVYRVLRAPHRVSPLCVGFRTTNQYSTGSAEQWRIWGAIFPGSNFLKDSKF